jgi:transcriptional regulator with XRE-family HTH domain
MKKTFESVSDAAAFLANDGDVKERVDEEIKASTLVNALVGMRIGKGVSQRDIAEAMGCTPSKISKLEAGSDSTMKWGDVCAYLSALGMNMNIMFDDSALPAADRIKQCVLRAHELLEDLVRLAEEVDDDTEITDKIHQFYGEVLFNFMTRFGDSYKRLAAVVKVPEAYPLKAHGAASTKARRAATGKVMTTA